MQKEQYSRFEVCHDQVHMKFTYVYAIIGTLPFKSGIYPL